MVDFSISFYEMKSKICCYPIIPISSTMGVAREYIVGDPQNLRSREGFCKEFKGWRGVSWDSPSKNFLES